jgi:hypothetical protein
MAPTVIHRSSSSVALGKSIGIIENEHDRFKANIVLAKVLPVFLFIPLKSHDLVATATAYGLFLRDVITFVHTSPGITGRGSKLNPRLHRLHRVNELTVTHKYGSMQV